MKKLYFLALVLLLATAGYSQVRKASKNDAKKQIASMQVTKGTENLKNIQNEPNMTRNDGELDYTTYDWQTNAGPRNWTIVWPDGKINFAYNFASTENLSDRGTGIGTYDVESDEWIPSGGRIENEKTSFGSIARYKNNSIVVVANASSQCGVYIIEDKDNMSPNSVSAVSYLDPTYDPYWPNVMTSGANHDIIHVVVTANGADGLSVSVPGAEGADMPILYFRSMDGGLTWDKENVILPYMGSEFGVNWGSHICYWMETTEDNCLALVVNNAWSDGFVLYSYDNGETWNKKTFYHHPGVTSTFNSWFMYPRWVSAQWDANGKLCLAYEFNCTTGEPGSGNYNPAIGGVAFWSENMPYHGETLPPSIDPSNPLPPTPGQPFIMDSAYLYEDIYASSLYIENPTHEPWPEYFGYLTELDPNGQVVQPYPYPFIDPEGLSHHGDYFCGVCAMPVLCKMPGDYNVLLAVWMAMDLNNIDHETDNYYFKLFATCSLDGGLSWLTPIHITDDFLWQYTEFVYPQVAVVDDKLVIACQADIQPGSVVHSGNENESDDTYYQGLTFYLYELLPIVPPHGVPEASQNTHMRIYPNPAVEQLNVTLNQNADIVVYNIMGQKVMKAEGHAGANSINISNLTSGIYFVNAGTEIQKFIVK